MSNLIKNELTKIFHKKSLYIVMIITLLFMILNVVLSKILENFEDTVYTRDSSLLEEELKMYDVNNPDEKERYYAAKVEIEIISLVEKYGINSWQTQIIYSYGHNLIYNVISNEETDEYGKYKKDYDDFISKLDNGDWKGFIQSELDEINLQISETTQNEEKAGFEITKQILEWRLQKNIEPGNGGKNEVLYMWENYKTLIRDYESSLKTENKTHRQQQEYEVAKANVALCEYSLNNDITEEYTFCNDFKQEVLDTNANNDLINTFSNYGLFILIAIVIIAGTSISEEFNKGTIKLLLVRPYKRTKILIAKFISCLIILVLVFAIVGVMQFIMGGIMHGFGNYKGNVIIYNYGSNSVEYIGLIPYLLLNAIAKIPQFILLMTLAFTLSAVFAKSPVAIALPLLGIIGVDIINALALEYEKAKFLLYFVTPNWDLSIYLFGKMPQYDHITLPFSIIICFAYFAIMAVTSMFVFKKRDIKNI